MFYAEKLQRLKERVQNATKSDDKFAQLIGIELYDYIQESKELKLEFDRRLNYLKNLAEDKDFDLLQDQIFDAVQNILKLTSLEEVQQKQLEWKNATSNYFKTKKKSEDDREDIWLTLPEIYQMAKEKKNYYRLGKGEGMHRHMGEISRNVYVLPVKDQYETNIEQLFKIVFFNKYLNNKKGQEKYERLTGEYNRYWYKMDELMYRAPIKLHISSFEQFHLDCVRFHQRDGYEFFYSPSPERYEQEFRKIKENTISVINDLLEALEVGKEEAVRLKNTLKSIHLISNKLEPDEAIFMVLDERFEMPVRFAVWNKDGKTTAMKKLYDIAYIADAPNHKVAYSRNVADGINNGLFKNTQVAKYVKTNKLEKPTLVKKSESNTLVLKNEISVSIGLIKNAVPSQHQSLYIDKTK